MYVLEWKMTMINSRGTNGQSFLLTVKIPCNYQLLIFSRFTVKHKKNSWLFGCSKRLSHSERSWAIFYCQTTFLCYLLSLHPHNFQEPIIVNIIAYVVPQNPRWLFSPLVLRKISVRIFLIGLAEAYLLPTSIERECSLSKSKEVQDNWTTGTSYKLCRCTT